MKALFPKYSLHAGFVIAGVLIVVAPVAASMWFIERSLPPTPPAPTPAVTTVTKTPTKATSTVSTSTKAQAAKPAPATQTANLYFALAGNIAAVNVKEGTKVSSGKILLTLSTSSLTSDLKKAKSTLSSAQAKLADLSKQSTVVVSTTSSASVQNALTQAQNSARTAIRNASINADGAIHNKTDKFFKDITEGNPKLAFAIADNQLSIDISSARYSIGFSLAAWDKEVLASSFATATNTIAMAVKAETDLNTINTFLGQCSTALDGGKTAKSLTQSQYSSDQSLVTSARLAISNSLNSVVAARLKEQQAQANLAASVKTTTDPNAVVLKAINDQKAVVASAQKKVDDLQTQINKSVLKSTVAGTVGKVFVTVGQTVASGTVAVSVVVPK